MPLYYSLADAVVAAPSSDGMPQSLFEALACEAPVVLARLPCYDEFVRHEESALLVERTPRALADAVVRLWSDDELRARLTRRGRGLVAGKADLDRNLDGLEARYRTLPGFSAAGGVPDRWRMKMTILRAIGGA
jgi:glycosyltransferase involved in cell wall biosynthesis